jgi:hypothetical protein
LNKLSKQSISNDTSKSSNPKELKEEQTKSDNKEETQLKEESKPNPPKSMQAYSFRTSIYRGNDGIEHIYREERDNKLGQTKTIETRRIGKQSMTLERIQKANGEVEEEETRNNIKDSEIEEFQKHWESFGISKASTKKQSSTQSIQMNEKKDKTIGNKKLDDEQPQLGEVQEEIGQTKEKKENIEPNTQ